MSTIVPVGLVLQFIAIIQGKVCSNATSNRFTSLAAFAAQLSRGALTPDATSITSITSVTPGLPSVTSITSGDQRAKIFQ